MFRQLRAEAFVCALLFGAATALFAQAPALGPEFQVTSTTTHLQLLSQVAADATGNFVVVWSGYSTGDATDVFARRFDAAGAPLGPDFIVNTFTGANSADIAMTPLGDFVVAWRDLSEGGDDSGYGVVARRFDAAGNPTSPVIPVNTYTTSNQVWQRVDIDPAGNFVVVWASQSQDGSGSGIFGQRFNDEGVKQGPEFQVNTETLGQQNYPDVAMDPTGGFVVVWEGYLDDASVVLAQRFDAVGVPLGSEFAVNQYSGPGFRVSPSIGSDDLGQFVVAWMSSQQTGDHFDVFARQFLLDGTPRGDEFRLNAAEDDVSQTAPEVAVGADGAFTIAWNSHHVSEENQKILARRYDTAGRPSTAPFQLNALTTPSQNGASVAVDGRGGFVIVWDCSVSTGSCIDGDGDGVHGRRGGVPDARPMRVDVSPSGIAGPAGGSNLNGVLEPEETAVVVTAWSNNTGAALALTGTASNFTGPAGPDYLLLDASADYGTIAVDATNDCSTGPPAADCVTVAVSGTRPSTHWDATLDEALSSGASKTWTLHVGGSFGDVPVAHQFYAFVENVFHNGITGGCGGGSYCPGDSVTRGQMAVFLLKSEHGADYVPPPCAGTFPDVSCPGLFADWIEQLAAEGITGGCGGGNYCPDNPVTRAQMAVFLLKTSRGSTYTPPACAGIFGDVACPGNPFADWIEQLAAEQITGGCGGGNYCPNNPNTRGQMAVFLTKTFALELYGP